MQGMLCQRVLTPFCSLLPASLLLITTATPALGAPAHVKDAETLLSDLTVSRQNVYGSNPSYIKWNGTASQARTVCGTFITNLLLHSYNLTTKTFTQWMGSTSPYPDTYHAAIVAQNHFTQIKNLQQVQPGDLIAIKYTDGNVTGHTMLVDGAPRPQSAMKPVVSGTTQYALTVIDSSSSNHGATDTRVKSPSTTGNGIGRGDIRIYVDASLKPVGYSWSNESGSPYYAMTQRPMAIGRIDLAYLGVKLPPLENQGGQNSGEGAPPPRQDGGGDGNGSGDGSGNGSGDGSGNGGGNGTADGSGNGSENGGEDGNGGGTDLGGSAGQDKGDGGATTGQPRNLPQETPETPGGGCRYTASQGAPARPTEGAVGAWILLLGGLGIWRSRRILAGAVSRWSKP